MKVVGAMSFDSCTDFRMIVMKDTSFTHDTLKPRRRRNCISAVKVRRCAVPAGCIVAALDVIPWAGPLT